MFSVAVSLEIVGNVSHYSERIIEGVSMELSKTFKTMIYSLEEEEIFTNRR